MATMLTFEPGKVPGIAPPSHLREPAPMPMTVGQREALRALIHTPGKFGSSPWTRRDSGADVVWIAVMMLALVVGLGSLVEGVRSLRNVDAPQTAAAARPQVGAVVEQAAPAKAARLTPRNQSSAATMRTM